MSEKSNTSQALWIAIGNMFSTGIALVSAMILSRYFNKEDYGTYKQVIYIYGTMQIVFTLGLPRCFSYFLPRLPIEQAKYTIRKITNIFYATGALFAGLLFVGAPFLADAFKNEKLIDAIRIYSPVAFFLLPTLGLEGILATFRKSEYIAVYNTLTRLFMLVCIVLPVILFHGGYQMALWGFVVSSFITYLLAIYLRYKPLKGIDHRQTTITYRDIWKFSLPLMMASIWGALINSTDQFFISRYFGTEAFANFSNGAAQLPFVGMVTASTVTVLTPLFTKYISEGNATEAINLWKRSTVKCAMILFPLVIFFIVFAKPLMVVMYGVQYEDSAIFFQIKQVASFGQIVTVGSLLIGMGETTYYSRVHMVVFFILAIAEFLVAYFCKSAYWVTAVHVAANLIICLFVFLKVSNLLKIKLSYIIPFRILTELTIISVICAVSAYYIVLKLSDINDFILLLSAVAAFLLIYLPVCHVVKIKYKELLYSFLPARLKNKKE